MGAFKVSAPVRKDFLYLLFMVFSSTELCDPVKAERPAISLSAILSGPVYNPVAYKNSSGGPGFSHIRYNGIHWMTAPVI